MPHSTPALTDAAVSAVPGSSLPEPVEVPARLPIDILHVSDSHFRGWWNRKRRVHWDLFVDNVRGSVAKGEFRPQLIAFTGDLVESAGTFATADAYRNGKSALLDLAAACNFIGQQLPADQWGDTTPPAWNAILNQRLFVIPGNHDVFVKGLRVGWQRWTKRWQEVAGGGPSLIAQVSCESGPLALRLIDTNGGRAAFKRARGVYDAAGNAAVDWPFDAARLFPVALMHGHPLQLPFLIEGIASEAGMMIDNSGSLLKDLGTLGVRLVLHGHRHLPNVCSVSVTLDDGTLHTMAVVAAGSVTVPAAQWPYFGYNWIRIGADRRVSVQIMKRDAGQRLFHPVDGRLQVADRGDFEYDTVERITRITEMGDSCGTIRVRGFRVRPDRPNVHAIPFHLTHPEGGKVAATRFSASRDGKPASKLTWDREVRILRIDPPHAAGDDPLDMELAYCIHNNAPRSRWEARELYGPGSDTDQISHMTMCTTRRVTLAVEYPPALATLVAGDFKIALDTGEPANGTTQGQWDPASRRMTATFERPRVGSRIELTWSLPSGEPRAAEESRIQIIREWQANIARAYDEGQQRLDTAARQIALKLSAGGIGQVDAGIFLACTNEVGARMGEGSRRSGLLLVGEHTSGAPISKLALGYGQGVVGRALRTGGIVWFSRLFADETRKDFEGGTTTPPDNVYAKLKDDRKYEVIVAVPVQPLEVKPEGNMLAPQSTVLVACIGTRDLKSPLLQIPGGEKYVAETARVAKDMLLEFMYNDITEGASAAAQRGRQ